MTTTKPTFMEIQREVDGVAYSVDRRNCPATDFWNFYFECYSVEDGGIDYYVEGMLALHDGVVEDFDGVFDLPDEIVAILLEMGYRCEWRQGDEYED